MPPDDTPCTVQVCLTQTGARYACATDESLLAGALRRGQRDIPAGCVNGGCGVCKVRVLAGQVRLIGPVSRARVTADEEAQGYTLACRAAPLSDVRLEVAAPLHKRSNPLFPHAGAALAASAFFPPTPPIKET